MAAHRPKHQTQQSLVSEYESDVQNLSDIPVPPSDRTDEELNLSVLRRYSRDVLRLEYVAPYVVVYRFMPESLNWEKSGVEGSTFLCALKPNEGYGYRCAVVVLNRRSLENFIVELHSEDDVEMSEEYIILKTEAKGQTAIYGLWVFREPPPSSTAHHPEEFAKKIVACVAKVEQRKVAVAAPEQQNGAQGEQEQHEKQESTEMGRQISLSQLFGQQRREDDSWSIRSHSPSSRSPQTIQHPQSTPYSQPVPQSQPTQPVRHIQSTQPSQYQPLAHEPPHQNTPQFTTTADTEFFRASYKPATSPSPAVSAQSNGTRRDNLLELFRKADENRPA